MFANTQGIWRVSSRFLHSDSLMQYLSWTIYSCRNAWSKFHINTYTYMKFLPFAVPNLHLKFISKNFFFKLKHVINKCNTKVVKKDYSICTMSNYTKFHPTVYNCSWQRELKRFNSRCQPTFFVFPRTSLKTRLMLSSSSFLESGVHCWYTMSLRWPYE